MDGEQEQKPVAPVQPMYAPTEAKKKEEPVSKAPRIDDITTEITNVVAVKLKKKQYAYCHACNHIGHDEHLEYLDEDDERIVEAKAIGGNYAHDPRGMLKTGKPVEREVDK